MIIIIINGAGPSPWICIRAALAGDETRLRALHDKGANLRVVAFSYSLASAAASTDQTDILKFLFGEGVDMMDEQGECSALSEAAQYGRFPAA